MYFYLKIMYFVCKKLFFLFINDTSVETYIINIIYMNCKDYLLCYVEKQIKNYLVKFKDKLLSLKINDYLYPNLIKFIEIQNKSDKLIDDWVFV